MVRKTKEEARETRDAILNAAVDVFVENGYARASVEDIAKQANTTRGAVYWHFKNKADIFDVLYEQFYMSVSETVLQDLQTDHPRPLQQLGELCTKMLTDLEQDVCRRQIMTLFFTKCDFTGELSHYQEKHLTKKKESRKLFARYFEKAIEKGGGSTSVDPEILANALCCYMKGITIEYLTNPTFFKMKDQAPDLVNVFFHGLAT